MMMHYLIELKKRSFFIFLVYIGLFSLFFFFANELFLLVVTPLLAPQILVATQVTAPLITPLKLAANAALLFIMPFVLLQLWLFMQPGLYAREQKIFKQILIYSFGFFLLGILFCYFFVLPFLFQFFQQTLPLGVRYLPDISSTLDFITHMLIIFGLCFQLPLICYVLVRLQLCQLKTLKKIRPYIIVMAFVLGMLLTPPDVLSQILLAIPLCLLYELGIGLCWLHQKKSLIESG